MTYQQNETLEPPAISPAQEAIWKESQRRWAVGMAAGEAGQPCPDDGDPMAFASGTVKRRAANGEIIGMVCQSCKCSRCGEQNWGWRFGCACWTEARTTLAPEGVSMLYGYQVDPGSDPDAPASVFLTRERMWELASGGREVFDVMTGKPVPIEP